MSNFLGWLRPPGAAALAALLASSSLPAAPLDGVRECADRVSPAISGIKDLGAACPQLAEALQTLGLWPQLSDDGQKRLNRDALHDLLKLSESYGGSPPGHAPDIAALPPILKALARDQVPLTRTWWDALRAWLKNWIAQHPGALNWLDRWLDGLGQSANLFQVIYYSLIALVLIGAVTVIVIELRAVGAGWKWRKRRSSARDAQATASAADDDSAGPEPEAVADKLTALLRKLVKRLMQTRRLDAERSLTHRELIARSAFDEQSQREVFSAVAGTAESTLYGRSGATPEQLNAILSQGRVLLTQLTPLPGAH